jgi:hypothetical protein
MNTEQINLLKKKHYTKTTYRTYMDGHLHQAVMIPPPII